MRASKPGLLLLTATGLVALTAVAAVVALVVAELLTVVFFPVGLVIWLGGLILLLVSKVWTGNQKLRGLLSLGTGSLLAMLAVATGFATGTTANCSSPAVQAPPPGTSPGATTTGMMCTTSGGAPLWITVLGLALAYLIYQGLTARALLRRRD